MATPLSPATIATIKATIPALEAHGLAIVNRMYARLFEMPALAVFFNKSHHAGNMAQPKALAGAVLAYAKYIETPEVLAAAIERIAQKHTSLQIHEADYAPVGEALLGAIADVLGEAATPAILDAWGDAYGFLAGVLSSRERDIYTANASARGGWTGWREFTVTERRNENAFVTTFRLEPTDKGKVMRHKAGQFLAFRLGSEGLPRNYSISSEPNDVYYEITVKRDGVGSKWLHDHTVVGTSLPVAAPAGNFTLGAHTGEVVFLAAGVGITPFRSMLAEMDDDMRQRSRLIHAVRDGAHAMPLPKLAAEEILLCEDSDGRIDMTAVLNNTNATTAHYYICGPRGFMQEVISSLSAAEVAQEHIHYEFFGPTEAV